MFTKSKKMTASGRMALLATTSTLLLASLPADAQLGALRNLGAAAGDALNTSDVRVERIERNQEQEPRLAATDVKSGNPFNIMIDGVPVFGDVLAAAAQDDQRTVDVGLDAMDIQVTFDAEEMDRKANVGAIRRSVGAGVGPVQFFTYWNYGAFVERAEVRMFRADGSVDGTPVAVLPVDPGKATTWNSTDEHGNELQYVLRIYGKDNRFDETRPQKLIVDDEQNSTGDEESVIREALTIYGNSTLETKNIEIAGGAVTVFGEKVPAQHRVFVMGMPVPVSQDGDFVIQEIVPSGHHNVTIAVLDPNNRGLEFQRNLYIPANDWFYVGLGDLTIGTGSASGPVELTGADSEDEGFGDSVDISGRAAMFLRGKIQGKYLLTAMLDTGEDEISELFSNLADKDPRKLLQRVDPDRYYPVYGDDSTTQQLAATQGRLFVRLEQGENSIMWGNYQTNIVGSAFANINRGLYGAHLKYGGLGQTSFGEKRVKVEAFAAAPGTMNQVDQFRGTGGSVYFLKRQDITIGAEKVRVVVRDKTTGVILNKRTLVANEDYDIDFIQGRIILFNALAGTADDEYIVSDQVLDGHPQYLEVAYEYTPAFTEIEGYTYGGRVEGWIGDFVKLGGTIHNDDSANQDRTLYEGDITLRLTNGAYIRGEYAQSTGQAYGVFESIDGGYSIDQTNAGVGSGTSAAAYRVEAGADLKELGLQGGRIGAYYQKREAGFSGSGSSSADDVQDYGVQAAVPIGEFVSLKGNYTVSDNLTQGTTSTSAKADANFTFGNIGAGLGVSHTQANNDGGRIDIGGQLKYSGNDFEVYGFGQTTVSQDANRARNARGGIGGKVKVTDRLALRGEVSGGDGGLGVKAGAEYQASDRTNVYLAYELTDRTNAGSGSTGNSTISTGAGRVTFGGKTLLTDALSVYGEERMDLGSRGVTGLSHAYGINYSPTDRWTFGAQAERGTVKNATQELSRTAVSGTVGYKRDGVNVGGALEMRIDETAAGDKRTTYVGRGKVGLKFNPNWRMQAKMNVVMTKANSNLQDGDFIEGSVGFAYRPVDNDRLNALFKYHGYYDLPTQDSVNSAGNNADYKQRSHIISADVIYDLTKTLSVGAKYGLKWGEVTSGRNTDDWQSSTVQLGILRADWHVVRDWDATVELRAMHINEIKSTKYGALAAIYRHFGDNLKIGVGYNFSDVSDDLTNVNANSQGVFINAITKF